MSRKKATISSNDEELHLESADATKEKASFGSLKDLIFLGSIERIVDIGGYKFRLRTLNGKQQKACLSKTMLHEEGERLSVLRGAILAESIVDVNGVPLESIYDGGEELSSLDMKVSVVESLQTSIIDKLYVEYDDLSKESNSLMEETSLKK